MRLTLSMLVCLLLLSTVTGCAFSVSGAGGAAAALQGAGTAHIRIEAGEFAFKLAAEPLPSGQVQFQVVNVGDQPHELMLVPVEDGRYGLPVVHVELPEPGSIETVSVNLAPGSYVFVCLLHVETTGGLVSHADLGMRLSVEAEG